MGINDDALIREIAPECAVLLKKDGSFPLSKPCKIAIFGNGARHTLRGGTGGGIVEVKTFTTVEEGLEKAGFEITSKDWLDGYDRILSDAKRNYRAGIKTKIATDGLTGLGALSIAMPEPEYDLPLTGDGDTAVYVLSRASGESADRSAEEGDVKLRLSEIRDIEESAHRYKKFMLVLNVSGVVDLSPVVDCCGNILYLSQLGAVTGDVFADIISGKSYPSGKLASTWAAYGDYCKIGDFGDQDDTRYKEGIYVGYRYFDSAGVKALFPFGFGMSYTEFTISAGEPTVNGSTVSLPVSVENTGSFKGKEVVQLYVSLPQGKLDQPFQALAAFKKTKELAPNECEKLILSFDLRDLSCFDNESRCRILEAGKYILRVGNSSRNTQTAGALSLDETAVVERVTHVGGVPDFEDWKPETVADIEFSNMPIVNMSAADIFEFVHKKQEPDKCAAEFVKGLTDGELAHLLTGYFSEDFSGQGSPIVPGAAGQSTDKFASKGLPCFVMADGPAGIHVCKEYGVDENGKYSVVSEETKAIKELLTPEMLAYCLKLFPDAANENRNGKIYEQNCTALPIETALAQSWNEEVCESCGKISGKEAVKYGIRFWLAPALNIHRSILCGRNFEYFSEDPLISGRMAAAIVRGAQSNKGIAACLKHFVCNEQETNRLYSNSVVSERALRDIYLRAFEIAVKESKPLAVMSSYNLVNGEHTAHRTDLMETVLRSEWGFDGMVMSDWVSYSEAPDNDKKYKRSTAAGCIRGGTDLMMPGFKGHYDSILNALNDPEEEYPLDREQLEKCATRVVSVFTKLLK